MIRTLLILALCAVIFQSCDKREDYFEKENNAPKLEIGKTESLSENDIWDTVKLANCNTKIYYKITDELESNPEITINKDLEYFLDKETIDFFPIKEGSYVVTMTAKDSYEESKTLNYGLYVFENMLPVAKLVVTNTALHDPFELELNAEKSLDQDYKYGGKITEYEYTIDDVLFLKTTENKVNTILFSSGIHSVELRVKDNDNVWSAKDKIFITL